MVDSIVNMSMAMKKAAEQGSIDDETRKEMESFETLCKMFLGK